MPPDPVLVELRRGPLSMGLVPALGGGWAWLRRQSAGGDVDLLRPASPEALRAGDPLGLASFPLAPWCNRIRDGRSDFGARPLRLPPNVPGSPHPLHGTAWQRPWEPVSVGPDEALMRHRHRPAAAEGDWPYAFEVRQHLRLHADRLAVQMALTNEDDVPMPAGLGHHPYLPHRPGTRLRTRVATMWEGDADLLPTRRVRPPFLEALAQGLRLDTLDLDNNFTVWSREARVDWPDLGLGLVLRAEPPLDFFVLYCPAGADHFVIEGVSNCTDWMNLAARGVGEAGGHVLAPGESLKARFELAVVAAP